MKNYTSILTKFTDDVSKETFMTKITGVIPTKENKGSLYIFNNESHVQLNDNDQIKKFISNIIRTGSCNGIPQEIGGVEDRTITSFVLNLKNIDKLSTFINQFNLLYSEVLLNETFEISENILKKNKEIFSSIVKILNHFKDVYLELHFKDCDIIYFDIYAPGYCDGYLSMLRNTNTAIDFVRMSGYSTTEDLKVGGHIIESGVSDGYIRPAPFTLGPIVFNPIGNDNVTIGTDGMVVNYIGLLRNDPKNFKEFRIYLTLDFEPDTIDGRFIGKSEESYNNFSDFIKLTKTQANCGGDVNYMELPFILKSVKVEIQGDNPEKIKANDIGTIFYKAFMNLTLCDLEAITSSESYIDGSCFDNISDNECKITFKSDNQCRLIPLFANVKLK